ncbi:hypothetical protein JCM3774_002503 [Rhodotorula dairenensis]
MSAPNTPIRPHVRSQSPAVRARGVGNAPSPRSTAAATASPQIRAALAALRKSRPTPLAESSNLADSPSSTPRKDARFSTPVRQRSAPEHEHAAAAREEDIDDMGDEPPVQLEWKMTDEASMVERAKRTGRLNLASRGLTAVPRQVYSALVHHSSPFHPSRRQPFDYRREEQFDFSIAAIDDDDYNSEQDSSEAAAAAPTVPWYEQQVLRSLNLANNELEAVGEELGGFEDLEFLDLHNNLLTTVPSSLAFLHNLTSLTLSHNRLSAFPLELLNLTSLRELSLAHNELTTLWPVDWRDRLEGAIQAPDISPSATPERAERFADVFGLARGRGVDGGPPWPNLTSLSLAGNRLGPTLQQPDFQFPAHLASLDLSDCGFVDSDIPIELLGRLTELVDLDLSRNQLDDHFPSLRPASSTTPREQSRCLFPSLERLHVAVNPIESLERLEAFLTEHVSRPIDYLGLPKVVENLVRNQERRDRRRLGVPFAQPGGDATTTASPQAAPSPARASAPDVESDAAELPGSSLQVDVRECFLRKEQARRRALFPPTASSLARERTERLQRLRGPQAPNPVPATDQVALEEPARPVSPGVPISPTSSTFDPNFVADQASFGGGVAQSDSPSTPTRQRAPIVLEAWEIEAAAGLSTPAGRRKAAARAAREAEQAAAAEEEKRRRQQEEEAAVAEAEQRRRGEEELKKEKARDDEQKADELADLMRGVKLDSSREDREVPDDAEEEEDDDMSNDSSLEPPPPEYSPRSPSPVRPPAGVSPAPTVKDESGGIDSTTDAEDPALAAVLSAVTRSAGKTSIHLASRNLSSLPRRSRPVSSAYHQEDELAPVTHVNLSHNQLTTMPCAVLHEWRSTRLLRVLDLSKNRLAGLDLVRSSALPAFPAAAAGSGEPLFPVLEVLDLSNNHLPSQVAGEEGGGGGVPVPLLAALASLAPALSELRLRQNRLTDLSGIADLVTGSSSSSSSSSLGPDCQKRRMRRLRILDLGENRIADLEALCAAAASSSASSSWRCDELDLSMNEIRHLPPRLGRLPDQLILHLIGNAFRFPKREVYEHAGERRVVPWLRERLQA